MRYVPYERLRKSFHTDTFYTISRMDDEPIRNTVELATRRSSTISQDFKDDKDLSVRIPVIAVNGNEKTCRIL